MTLLLSGTGIKKTQHGCIKCIIDIYSRAQLLHINLIITIMTTKKCLWALLSLCFIAFSCNEESESVSDDLTEASVIPGQYIVVLKDDAITAGRVNEPEFTDREAKIAYTNQIEKQVKQEMNVFFKDAQIDVSKVTAQYTSLYSGFAAKLTKEEVLRLENDPRVDFVEQDRMVTLDFEVEAIYEEGEVPTDVDGGRIEAQTTTCAVQNAGGPGNGASDNNKIWIIDTGVDLDHPDLNVNRSLSVSFSDGNPDDSNGHGTHCAGIAAAINNSIGPVGVSAGAEIVGVDVLGSGSGSFSTIIRGMDYVAGRDISGDVANMSLGGSTTSCSNSSSVGRALERLNNQSYIAIAAGNSSTDARGFTPACYNLTRVYTIASMTCGGSFSSFSNWGTPVDYIATGSSVYSTYRGGRYATLSGTSMAAPVVAGVLHQRGTPRSCGTVSYRGVSYPVACR